MPDTLGPRSHAEAVAHFRAQLVGPLLAQEFEHGALAAELRRISRNRYRPPGCKRTRTYGVSTLERWYYDLKHGGLEALVPRRRSDAGHARALTEAQRQLLLDIRSEYPSASADLIVETLTLDGRLEPKQVSPSTVRRLFSDEGLPRLPRRQTHIRGARRRWEARHPGWLWHADVCHGPTLTLGGRRTPLRIHAILDDASRYVVALFVCTTEREVEMLELFSRALRRWGGAPGTFYLDNGPTYVGEMFATVCARLRVSLVHARPYDPQARGKMERFWRTLREGWLDHLGEVHSLHDVQVRLLAWLDGRYHVRPHGGLMGRTPKEVWEEDRRLADVSEAAVVAALTAHGRRRVRGDGTLSVGGVEWETDQGFLAGRLVRVERSLAEPNAPPVIVHEDQRYELRLVDAVRNGAERAPFKPKPGIDAVEFDPTQVILDSVFGRLPKKEAP